LLKCDKNNFAGPGFAILRNKDLRGYGTINGLNSAGSPQQCHKPFSSHAGGVWQAFCLLIYFVSQDGRRVLIIAFIVLLPKLQGKK